MNKLNLRKRPRISYYEPDEPSLDEYVFCTDCRDYVYEYCSIHGPLLIIPDDKVPSKSPFPPIVPRAALTIPHVFLHIAPSIIPGAGLGVFSTLTLPKGVRFGPYRGIKTTEITSTYCWQIYDSNNRRSHVVDAEDANRSNWMRYVNCSRHWFEQNLVAFQYKGELYYRTIKIIPRFTELMVFYGGEFANMLRINLRRYNSPADYAQKFGAVLNKSVKDKRASKPLPAKEKKINTFVPPVKESNLKINENKKIGQKCNEMSKNVDTFIKSSNNDKTEDDNNSSKKFSKNKLNRNGNIPSKKSSPKTKVQKSNKSIVDKELNNNATNNKEYINEENNSKDNIVTKKQNIPIPEITQRGGKKVKYTQVENVLSIEKKALQIVNRVQIDNNLSCGLCEYKAKTKKILETHLLLHCDSADGKNIHSCHICQYKCIRKVTLRSHMKTHTGEKPYSCSICQYKCIQKVNLRSHMKTHTGEKPYSCSICQYKCIHKVSLRSHMKTHNGEKPYSCSICQYKCIQKGTLRSHMKTHTGEKPYSCSICQYKCIRKDSLRRHMKTHTGEKPYSCSICQYKCIQKGTLRSHMKTHTGEKPYSCSICQYKCIQKVNLRSHMKTHTGEKPYSCSICQYKCIQKVNLRRHMKTHTGEKPYSCSICQYKCIRKDSLRSHMKTHTGEKP